MNNIIHDFARFFENIISGSDDIEIDESCHEKIDRYVSGDVDFYRQNVQRVTGKIKDKVGVDFPKNQDYLYCLQGQAIRWSRSEQKSGEGTLGGGFYVNGVIDIFLYPIDFWEGAVREFSDIGCEYLADIPENMRWFESTVAHNRPLYAPHYGCVLFEPPSFPDKFFFYDSGFLFPLPFASFEEYFLAMIDSAAVKCWQYFYIDPEDIIKKNRDVSYITWSLHVATHLDEKMRRLTLDETVKYDRLDLINEYLERCVRLLPTSFPFIDFSHHREYYSRFKGLYDKQK